MGASSSQEAAEPGNIPETTPDQPNDAVQGGLQQGGLVPAVFRWTEEASQVFVVGSYSGWKNKIALARDREGVFSATLYLPRGVHEYKFIVDGTWRCASSQPKTRDKAGNENNWVVVEEMDESVFSVAFDPTQDPPPSPRATYASPDAQPDDFLKEPPFQPPHLMVSLLNQPSVRNDPLLLPQPHHVLLNHFNRNDTIVDGMRVQGVTRRVQTKFVTTVLYTPVDD